MPTEDAEDTIDPRVQLQRDEESLRILLEEKKKGVIDVPGMLVNVSKNPVKEVYKDRGIDGEIARRILQIGHLKERILKETK